MRSRHPIPGNPWPVQIPCRGTFTRVGAHGLLVTAETRDEPARFREALAVFG